MIEFPEVEVDIMDDVPPEGNVEYLLVQVGYLARELACGEVEDGELDLLAVEEGLGGPGERDQEGLLLLGEGDTGQVEGGDLGLVELVEGGEGSAGVWIQRLLFMDGVKRRQPGEGSTQMSQLL